MFGKEFSVPSPVIERICRSGCRTWDYRVPVYKIAYCNINIFCTRSISLDNKLKSNNLIPATKNIDSVIFPDAVFLI